MLRAVRSGFRGPCLTCFGGSKSLWCMVLERALSTLQCREMGDLLHLWPARVKLGTCRTLDQVLVHLCQRGSHCGALELAEPLIFWAC